MCTADATVIDAEQAAITAAAIATPLSSAFAGLNRDKPQVMSFAPTFTLPSPRACVIDWIGGGVLRIDGKAKPSTPSTFMMVPNSGLPSTLSAL